MRIRIRAEPFGAFTDIFKVIAHNPLVTIDADFEKSAISLGSLNESTLHCIHGSLVDDLLNDFTSGFHQNYFVCFTSADFNNLMSPCQALQNQGLDLAL
jgi:hypothetical protein